MNFLEKFQSFMQQADYVDLFSGQKFTLITEIATDGHFDQFSLGNICVHLAGKGCINNGASFPTKKLKISSR